MAGQYGGYADVSSYLNAQKKQQASKPASPSQIYNQINQSKYPTLQTGSKPARQTTINAGAGASGAKVGATNTSQLDQKIKEYNDNNKPDYYGDGDGGGGVEEYIPDYSAILDELRELANQKYQALQEALMKNKQRQDDDARRRYALNERRWKRTYGNGTNGQGLSSLFDIRNAQNQDLAGNERDYSTNMANLLAGKYDDNFNIAKLLMQYQK